MPTWLPPPRAFAAVLRLRNRDNHRPSERWCTEILAWSPTLPRDGSPSDLYWIAAPTLLAGRRDREREIRDFLFAERTVPRVSRKQKRTGIRANEEDPLRSRYRRSARTPRR